MTATGWPDGGRLWIGGGTTSARKRRREETSTGHQLNNMTKQKPDDHTSRRTVLRSGIAAGTLLLGGKAMTGSVVADEHWDEDPYGKTTSGVTFDDGDGYEVNASCNAHGEDHPQGPAGACERPLRW